MAAPPKLLGKRVEQAKARAAAALGATERQPPKAAKPGTKPETKAAPLKPHQPAADAPNTPAAANAPANAGKPPSDPPGYEGQGLQRSDAEIASTLRSMATNPQAASLVTDAQLVAAWNGMVNSAAKGGTGSVADRAGLFKAMGLPFYAASGGGMRGAAGFAAGLGVGERVGRALARVEAAALGRAAVTLDGEAEEEVADSLASLGDAPKIKDQVRVTDSGDEGLRGG